MFSPTIFLLFPKLRDQCRSGGNRGTRARGKDDHKEPVSPKTQQGSYTHKLTAVVYSMYRTCAQARLNPNIEKGGGHEFKLLAS